MERYFRPRHTVFILQMEQEQYKTAGDLDGDEQKQCYRWSEQDEAQHDKGKKRARVEKHNPAKQPWVSRDFRIHNGLPASRGCILCARNTFDMKKDAIARNNNKLSVSRHLCLPCPIPK